ncbi:AAA family ATPase [Aeromicrobium choanae]|uniref:Predicted ATPase n=1 Tax=Aeromicrobium choanae TaxID=1736691 RepID=A0A1T4YRD1_9ACTN|nr:ATP-binding protein [Aeromicrobium choanae]SKB03801.1 Predicted ATPase [Aeromicrobium choanae]
MAEPESNPFQPRFHAIELTNFLSYKHARLEFGDLIALVGPNASGKSNLVAAIKLLREIPIHGLPVALARRGGFDQLRHRSAGRPYDPGLRIEFTLGDSSRISHYELRLGAVKPRNYRVKLESATVYVDDEQYDFESDGERVATTEIEYVLDQDGDIRNRAGESFKVDRVRRRFPIPPAQSALPNAGFAGFVVLQALQRMQTIEVNPAKVGELQEPSSTQDFEPDGGNTTSIFELLEPRLKNELVDELSAIVPGIVRIEVQRLADRHTLKFVQETASGNREFFAKQMSDGTLRAFSILLAMKQPSQPALFVIEEPEIAIHLGALRTLVDILEQEAEETQIILTTHSADIVDSVDVEALRVVWNDGGDSRIGTVALHTIETVRSGLITPGQLLRSDSLDLETDE